jgi:hypothetical protein
MIHWVELMCDCGWNVDEYHMQWDDLRAQITQHLKTCDAKED